ncbi:SDR family oxidoreductase [Altericista sp. CCNU0014]|uniref:SDR family oxidoreductase n=1 Tax=Altericista sp. CCNU0014 TaxID=3082949 RepID=UPI00384C47E2
MKVLILGCGYTGQRLARWLVRQKIDVCATNRSGTPLEGLNIPVFPFFYASQAAAVPLPHAALEGVTHVLSTIAPDPQGIDPVAASLMPTLQRSPLTWFGYLSTTGVYGDTQGEWVDEESPLQPQNARSQYRAAIEATFLHSGLPAHIFRLPGIYGPGRSILDKLRAGAAQHIRKPGHVFSRIHVDDIVQTLWQSMRSPSPGSIYNVSDDEPSEPSTLIVEGAKLLNLSPPVAQPYEQIQLNPMAASFWSECRRIRNRKIKQVLGVRLAYPTYREGLRAILTAETAKQP